MRQLDRIRYGPEADGWLVASHLLPRPQALVPSAQRLQDPCAHLRTSPRLMVKHIDRPQRITSPRGNRLLRGYASDIENVTIRIS